MSWKHKLASYAVLIIVLVAGGVRISYVAFAKRGPCAIEIAGKVVGTYHSECTGGAPGKANDQVYYNAAANQLADGKGFTDAFHPNVPAADHPPLTAVVLAGVSFAFDHLPFSELADKTYLPSQVGTVGGLPRYEKVLVRTHVREQRYFMALLGTLNVFLIMLLARRIAGRGVSLLTGAFAALYPFIWVNDGLLFSETVAITCVVCTLLAALWCVERPSAWRFAVVGVLCALSALARAELLILAPLLILAIGWWARRAGTPAMLAGIAAGVIGCVAVLTPWFVYNAGRFQDRVLISTNDGLALAGSNCNPMYHGSYIGLWVLNPPCAYTDAQLATFDAHEVATAHRHLDQSEISDLYRHKATNYMRQHLGRLPIVVAARVGRVWNVFRPFDMVRYNQGESRERWVTQLGLVAYYPLMLLAIAGGFALVRLKSAKTLWVLIVPAISVTAVAAATYGQTRLRATAEPSLVVLAAIGASWLVDRYRVRRSPGTAVGEVATEPVPLP